MRLFTVLSMMFFPWAGLAEGHQALFGAWGTKAQCAGDLLIEGGSVRAAPMEISEGWLKHGDIWCGLTWFPVQLRPDGVFASTSALCGEDSQRSYRVDLVLAGDELRVVWDEAWVIGPLGGCAH